MDPAIAAIIGAGVGASVGGFFSVWLTKINKKSEEQRHKQELAVQIAIAEYQAHLEKVKHEGGPMLPPQIYFVHAIKFMNEIDISKDPKELAKQIEKITTESKKLSNDLRAKHKKY